jgi:hypothetical protein
MRYYMSYKHTYTVEIEFSTEHDTATEVDTEFGRLHYALDQLNSEGSLSARYKIIDTPDSSSLIDDYDYSNEPTYYNEHGYDNTNSAFEKSQERKDNNK